MVGRRYVVTTLMLVLFATVVSAQGADILDTYLDRTYYTTERSARVLASVDLPAEQVRARGLRVSVAMRNGEPVTAEAKAAPWEAALTLPLEGLANGTIPVEVTLSDKGGAVVAKEILMLRKLPPAPSIEYEGVITPTEVKIDQENRCLLVNGKPFFPYGIWSHRIFPDWLEVYEEIGFNCVLLWQGPGQDGETDEAIELFDLLQGYNLYAIPRPLHYAKRYGNLRRDNDAWMKVVEELSTDIKLIRHHPAILVHYAMDEAPERGIEAGLKAFLDMMHEVDPYHPVYMGTSTPSRMENYDFADIHGRHTYWGPMGSPPHRTPNRIARVCKWAYENVTEPNHRPFFYVPQAETTSHSRRALTPQERRITVYLGLVHGAKSCVYFRAAIQHRATIESMKQIGAEIQALAPALLRQRIPQQINVNPGPEEDVTSPQPGQETPYDMPIVQALYAEMPEGGDALLIAGNSHWLPVQATWDLSALGGDVQVSDFFSGEAMPVAEGVVQDEFERFGVRVYRIQGATRQPGKEVVINVDLDGPAIEHAGEVMPAPETKGPEAKNIMLNSSFEDAALPGWPDAWWVAYPFPGRRCGDPDGPGQDPENPYHGKFSMRIVNPWDFPNPLPVSRYLHTFPNTYLRGGIPVEKGQKYVFSAYMRTNKPGTAAEVVVCNYAYNGMRREQGVVKEFELTGDWKRYEVVFEYAEEGWNEGHRPDAAISIANLGADCSIWVDAVQFEKGTQATEYER